MMHQFRAKTIDDNKWVYGNYVCINYMFNNKHIIIPDYCNMFSNGTFEKWYEVDGSTVCPCTGVCDINGYEIYDEDVIVVDNAYKAVVLWHEFGGAFIVNYDDKSHNCGWDYLDNCSECEIIGNDIDAPNLFDTL
jgi:uncharacterized phage protein (TIGR01671 family)